MKPGFLTPDQIEFFLQNGYIRLSNCFDPDFAKQWTDVAFKRLGYDANDPTTWTEPMIHMPTMNTVLVKDFAPTAYAAMCDLVGGEDRIAEPENVRWGDGFILNFANGADHSWQPPSTEINGWHKDGDFFYHFLDSPEQGLLVVVTWKSIGPRGGATFISCDSVPVVARYLVQHPEGVNPFEIPADQLIQQCQCFEECTGETGDVFLLHPYMLHASSQNVSGIPRFMTNPCLALREPMNFNRANADDFSPVELSVLRGLGVERLDFKPTLPRREHVPERIRIQREMLAQEQQRLAEQQ